MILIDQLLIGSVVPYGPRGLPSAISKKPATDKCWLGLTGFVNDEQGDRKHHGGVEKAVHHYDFSHYPFWRDELGNKDVLRQAGAFGENLSSCGISENEIAIGDIFKLGDALVQVSQGRQPCWKLNIRFDTKDMALRLQKTGRTGWYYRVLREGYVQAGDHMTLLERLKPEWTIRQTWHVLYVDMLNHDLLSEMAELKPLADDWRQYARKRLASGKVEDWNRRLKGDA
ncbi:MOSC domain-containing protein [Brucellaceae bacterium C25G]